MEVSSTDPLDQMDFDAITYINQRFQTEESLENLDTFVIGISSQIAVLDDELSKAVQTQNQLGEQASEEIKEANEAINELFGKITDIKLKASQSECMVQEICADIKKLDYAKNHLQTSVTALKRLQMLIAAVGQLEMLNIDCSYSYSYRDAANLLDAVKQLMTHFVNYSTVPMIAEIKDKVEAIQTDLRNHVHKAFKEIGQLIDTVAEGEVISSASNILFGGNSSNGSNNSNSPSDACVVVDALGYAFRHELLEEFVQLQLAPYEKLFGPEKAHYSLEDADRRWAWFKRLIKSLDSKCASLFPSHWQVQLRLCLEFFERTKIHLALLLTDLESRDQADVNSLLKGLKTALKFEKEMAVRFDVARGDNETETDNTLTRAATLHEKKNDARLKADGKLMYIATQDLAVSKEEQEDKKFILLAHAAISGGISAVFDKFLGSYVLLERQNLEEMLEKLQREEDGVNGSGSGSVAVFASSMNMFAFIKNSISRCTSLSNGQTFLSLTKEFQACMQQYVNMLTNRLVGVSCGGKEALTVQSAGGGGGAVTSPSSSSSAESTVCYIINTCEYCAEVVPQLEQLVKNKISKPLKDKVDFNPEAEAFTELVALALRALVGGTGSGAGGGIVLDRLEPAYRALQYTNWANLEDVAEESAYCRMFQTVLLETVPKVRESLSPSYFNNFCLKCATEILQRYQDSITKQKRISEMASQQLLLDTYNLKTLLLHLHNTGNTSATLTNISPMYTRLVNAKVAHIEAILKLVGTPEDMLVERFRAMWPDGQAADLQMLMSMKGMRRQDQQSFLETLGLGMGIGMSNINVATTVAMTTQASISSISMASSAFTSSARNAVGNLKWGSSVAANTNNNK